MYSHKLAGIIFCMLTVVYLPLLKHKLVFLLPHGAFTDSFSVGLVKGDKVMWLQAD
jgi:hypothetical protein